MRNPLVSCYTNTTRPCFKVPSAPEGKQFVHFPFINFELISVFREIRKGSWQEQLNAIKSNKGGYEKNKKNLPCFTPSGTFRTRNDWDLIEYSQVVHLDYDNIANPEALRDRVSKSPYCLAAFISPGGEGLKVFVVVDSNEDLHQNAFSQVRELFDELTGIKSDSTARNLSRLCYVSVDPGCYINEKAEVFKVSRVKSRTLVPDASILMNPDNDKLFGWLFNLTQKGKFQGETFPAGYSQDHRNNFIFLFACNCNRYGIDRHTAHEFAQQIWVMNNENFNIEELKRTVNSAYSYTKEFASYNLPKHLQNA